MSSDDVNVAAVDRFLPGQSSGVPVQKGQGGPGRVQKSSAHCVTSMHVYNPEGTETGLDMWVSVLEQLDYLEEQNYLQADEMK